MTEHDRLVSADGACGDPRRGGHMSFDDWMLALHVLSAFAWVAGVIVFWVLIVGVRRADTADETIRLQPVGRIGNASPAGC